MAKRKSKSAEDLNEFEVEALEDGEVLPEVADETFAEAKGTPANVHAKKLAKEKSDKPKAPSGTFYTQKGNKILQIIVKPHGTHQVFIANAVKHKSMMEGFVKKWKKEGIWAEGFQAKEKIEALRAALPTKPEKKK